MSPIVYNETSEEADYDYIKKQRGMIFNDLETYLEYDFHVHRNGALVVLNREKNMKGVFPGGRAISDIVLMFNSLVLEKINCDELTIGSNDTITVSKAYFESLIQELKNRYGTGWSKEYREKTIIDLNEDIVKYMKDFNMIKNIKGEKEIVLLPLIGKVIGNYPNSYIEKIESEE